MQTFWSRCSKAMSSLQGCVRMTLRMLVSDSRFGRAVKQDKEELEFAKQQSFPQTATGENLEMHALERGIFRKQATRAKGIVRFPGSQLHRRIF